MTRVVSEGITEWLLKRIILGKTVLPFVLVVGGEGLLAELEDGGLALRLGGDACPLLPRPEHRIVVQSHDVLRTGGHVQRQHTLELVQLRLQVGDLDVPLLYQLGQFGDFGLLLAQELLQFVDGRRHGLAMMAVEGRRRRHRRGTTETWGGFLVVSVQPRREAQRPETDAHSRGGPEVVEERRASRRCNRTDLFTTAQDVRLLGAYFTRLSRSYRRFSHMSMQFLTVMTWNKTRNQSRKSQEISKILQRNQFGENSIDSIMRNDFLFCY